MKSIFLLLSFFLLVSSSLSQDTPRKIISTPSLQPPPEAVESGLGGRVNVEVAVNTTGDVTEVKQVAGPGWICPKVKRYDVQAIQETARTVSMQVKFAPNEKESTEWIGITFPASKSREELNAETQLEKPDTAGAVTVTRKRPTPRMINGGVLNGRAVRLVKPPYPPDARAARASGIVSIKVHIDEDGSIFSAEPIDGHRLLMSSARQAACLSEFSPTKLEGKAVKVTGVITYNFVP